MTFIDFESYYDPAIGYTLSTPPKPWPKLSMLEYIKDPRFKTHGVGVMTDGHRAAWLNHGLETSLPALVDGQDVVAHNAKFDVAIAMWRYGCKPGRIICTQAMARAVLGTRAKSCSLRSLAEFYGMPPKGEMQTAGKETLTPDEERALAEYCLRDVEICQMLYKEFAKTFPASQYASMDWSIRCFVEPALRLDKTIIKGVYDAEKVRRESIFTKVGIDKAIFASNKKFPELLRGRGYEIPTKKSPTTGKDIPALAVTDEGFIELSTSGNQELDELCEARLAAKATILETRSEKFLRLAEIGPWPFDVQFSGAKQTHRFSGADGAGGNPQNLPKKSALRQGVCPQPGMSLVVGDFAAIEARIVAWLAKETKLIDIFVANGDPYLDFASRYFKRPLTKKDNKMERDFGKESILGLGYNMGAKKFVRRVKLKLNQEISQEEGWEVVKLYRTTYFRIPALWEQLESLILIMQRGGVFSPPAFPFLTLRAGSVVLPSGLALQYPNLRQEVRVDERGRDSRPWIYDMYKHRRLIKSELYGGKLLENISQALAGELKKVAIARARAAGLRCVGEVHDEILAIHLNGSEGKTILHQAMEAPIPWWPSLKLVAEVGYGPSWAEAKP